jgi:hypothetical protein
MVMPFNTRLSLTNTLVIAAILAAAIARADSLVLVTSAGGQGANDYIHWSKLGADGTVVPASFNIATDKAAVAGINLAGANSIVSVVCTSTPCSWTGVGFAAKDSVLWTSDAGAGGNGPVTLHFGSGVNGAGGLIQADAPGPFTAQIQAYNGATLLGSFTVISNNNGDAAYIGVTDQTGPNITSVVFSLTACASVCSDFALDTVNVKASSGAPAVSLSPTSLVFGNQNVGTVSPAKTVTLSNTGTAPLAITSIVNTGDFKTTNSCGTSVAAGASCSISVTFAPTVTGTRSGTLTITDNATNSPQSVSLTGTGVAPAVTLSPTGLAFAAQLLNTVSAAKIITLTNTGTAPLTVTSIAASGDFAQTNTCGTSVAAGGKCTITVTFKPTAIGARAGAISIVDNATGSPQKVSLTGTGTQAQLSATTLAFPVTALGVKSAAKNVTLTNVGTTTLTISGVSITGTNAVDFSQTNTCGTSLAAGASCTISVAFSPTAIGSRTGSVAITDSGGGSPQSIALSGIGTQVKLSATAVAFPVTPIGTTSASIKVTLTNVGSTALAISGFSLGGVNPTEFTQANNCGTSVAAAASCTITVAFKPIAAGVQTATVSITDSGGGSPQSVAMSGTGTQLKLSASALTFAGTAVGTTSAAQAVTVTNVSTGAIGVTSIALVGINPGDFAQTNTCGTSIPAAASCTITVRFKPTATGTRTANLSLTDAAVNSPQIVKLTGTGL